MRAAILFLAFRRPLVLFGFILASGAALSACGTPEHDRYRMTVEISTPSGTVSGSSVREVMHTDNARWFPFGESKAHAVIAGEAVAVKLPSGQIVYALLAGQANDLSYASGLMGRTIGRNSNKKAEIYQLWPKPSGEVDDLPLFAYFQIKSDPTSFKVIPKEAFESTFGEGVYLKALFLERSNDPITREIHHNIPSFDSPNFQKWLESLTYSDPRQMILGGLTRGRNRES